MIGPSTQLFISVSSRPGGLGAFVYNTLFAKHRVDALYAPRPAPEDARALIASVRGLSIKGCSVSMPLKRGVLPLLDAVDDDARASGAVNTIVNEAGKLSGFNTDIAGICGALGNAAPRSAVVYGAGATAGSAIIALRKLGCRNIAVSGRTPVRTAELCRATGEKPLEVGSGKFELLINATPAAFSEPDPALVALIERADCVFDVALKWDSWVVERATAAGKKAHTGFDMYTHQVRRQFEIYTGISEPVEEFQRLVDAYEMKR